MNFAYQGRQPPAKLAAMASAAPPQYSQPSPPWQAPTTWISDSGATDHFTPEINNLPDCSSYTDSQLVLVGNGQQLPISHVGNAQLSTSSSSFDLQNILHDRPTEKHLYTGPNKDGLYTIHGFSLPPRSLPSSSSSCTQFAQSNVAVKLPPSSTSLACLHSVCKNATSFAVWHSRLGHPHDRVLQHVLTSHLHQHVPSKFSFFHELLNKMVLRNARIAILLISPLL
uniref:Retrovirus-related Pol polyprotein from transposon TNT 1-94-like beta-barrel domain-containing protein n=1 Tax=Fagus sylvatica TaxID=28930 RepID=A0A2N9IV24_FAGSY